VKQKKKAYHLDKHILLQEWKMIIKMKKFMKIKLMVRQAIKTINKRQKIKKMVIQR